MHGSRLPITVWFWGAHVVASTDDSVPVRQLKKLLGVSYKAAWELRKTLEALKDQAEDEDGFDDSGPLEGLVEINRMEFIPLRHGSLLFRGERNKILLAIALETVDRASFPYGTFRLETISDSSAQSIERFVRSHVKPGATLVTDGHVCYRGLTGYHLDPRYHGKLLPRSGQVLAFVENWFSKAAILDRKAVDQELEFIRAHLALDLPRPKPPISFETLLELALRHKPSGS